MNALLTFLVPFLFVLTRLGGVAVALPVLLTEIAPMRIRAAATIIIAISMTPLAMQHAPQQEPWFALIFEFGIGLCMGFVVRLCIAAIEVATTIGGYQLGFGFSSTVDPLTEKQSSPITLWASGFTSLIFFVSGAHHEVFRALALSFRRLPAGSARLDWRAVAELLIEDGSVLFESGMRIAVPLVVTGLATQLFFGLLTRIAPGLNLWALGFLATIGTGVLAMMLYGPALTREAQAVIGDGLLGLKQLVGG